MFYYLKDGDREIDAMMESVCETGGGGQCVTDARWRRRGFPETEDRARASLRTAKHQPRGKYTPRLKRLLYSLQYNWFRAHFQKNPDALAVAWNGITGTRRAYMAAARDAGRPRLFMERSPFPGRVTLDPVGINQLNSLPRDRAFYIDWAQQENGRPDRDWLRLRETLVARTSRRTDVSQNRTADALAGHNFVFCPLQVPDDTQIRQFGGWIESLERFVDVLELAARALPDGWHLRIKEHPSSKIPLTEQLRTAEAALPGRIVMDNDTDTFLQVGASQAVITLNSSVGLQAFFFEKPVLVLGEAFFRMAGLVTPIDSLSALCDAFAHPQRLDYDAALRDAFMSYLDQVYYPTVETDGSGKLCVDPANVRRKIEQAMTGAGS